MGTTRRGPFLISTPLKAELLLLSAVLPTLWRISVSLSLPASLFHPSFRVCVCVCVCVEGRGSPPCRKCYLYTMTQIPSPLCPLHPSTYLIAAMFSFVPDYILFSFVINIRGFEVSTKFLIVLSGLPQIPQRLVYFRLLL